MLFCEFSNFKKGTKCFNCGYELIRDFENGFKRRCVKPKFRTLPKRKGCGCKKKK